MSTQLSGRIPATILAIAGLVGLALGVNAQLLRQINGPLMALGGATAPWLTVGFLLAIWATRPTASVRHAARIGIATFAVYLVVWLISYHLTFSIRELIKISDAWREAAPWLLLAGPVSVVLGLAAAATHKNSALGDLCLGLPVAWSMPEITLYVREGWSLVIVVALPTVIVALSPLLVVGRRDVKLLRVVVASGLFGVAGLAFLPVARNLIHS
jgi:hypothetical protein